MKSAWSAAALLAFAGSNAAGQRTHLYLEAASDAAPAWSSTIVANPGDTVVVRLRVAYDAMGSGVYNAGFAGMLTQPTLASWDGTDTLLSFSPALPPDDGSFGRVYPFTSSDQSPGSATGALTAFIDGPGTLRFAGSKNVTPTTNLQWGLSSTQRLYSLNPTGYNSNLDVVVFRFAFVAGTGGRTLVASAPIEWIYNEAALWFPCGACIGLMNTPVTPETIHPASTTIVPATPPVVLMFLGVGSWGRRRGRNS